MSRQKPRTSPPGPLFFGEGKRQQRPNSSTSVGTHLPAEGEQRHSRHEHEGAADRSGRKRGREEPLECNTGQKS